MLGNYLKAGFRNLKKDYRFTVLNLFGLSMGLGVFSIMILLVSHELSFDNFHEKSDRIFEVIQVFQNSEGEDPEIWTAIPLAEALREELSIVENSVTVHAAASSWLKAGEKRFFEEGGIVAGGEFFQIFDFTLKTGNPDLVLAEPYSMVITETMASRLFGDEDPIGQVVDIASYGLFTVTGVLKPLPSNSFIQFDFIITQNYEKYMTMVAPWFAPWFQSWEGDPAGTFVLLKDPSDAKEFEELVEPLLKRKLGLGSNINPHKLINLRDLHFELNGVDGRINEFVKGDRDQIMIFMMIAFIILGMACFNYINLTTARSARRGLEVGIRKSLGAQKNQISIQFLVESFVLVLISIIISMVWVVVALPFFKMVTGIQMDISAISMLNVLPYFLITLLVVTVLAGSYPAMMLSRFSAIKALKGNSTRSVGGLRIRNVLVLTQYILVMVLLSLLATLNRQFEYMSNKKLGFDTDQLIIVEINNGEVRTNFENLKNDLLTYPSIQSVTGLTRMISGYRSSVGIWGEDKSNPELTHPFKFYGMDSDGLSTLELELVAGEDFTGVRGHDSLSVFLNETAAEMYGGNDILGQYITLSDSEASDFKFRVRVIGILKDFHHSSMHDPISPVVVGYYKNPFEGLDDIVIKVSGTNIQSTLSFIEEAHNQYDENDIMTWDFLDNMIRQSYEKETMFRKIFTAASIVSVVIAILGVIGLVSYNTVSRTKEFGIRKVLGATFSDILVLQGKSFIHFLLAASLIAVPLAWIISLGWLESYAFRVQLTPLPFTLVVVAVSVLTIVTIVFIGRRTAKENPVDSLRYE